MIKLVFVEFIWTASFSGLTCLLFILWPLHRHWIEDLYGSSVAYWANQVALWLSILPFIVLPTGAYMGSSPLVRTYTLGKLSLTEALCRFSGCIVGNVAVLKVLEGWFGDDARYFRPGAILIHSFDPGSQTVWITVAVHATIVFSYEFVALFLMHFGVPASVVITTKILGSWHLAGNYTGLTTCVAYKLGASLIGYSGVVSAFWCDAVSQVIGCAGSAALADVTLYRRKSKAD